MPTVQISSPLPGDTPPTNFLVSGYYSLTEGGVGAIPDKPKSDVAPPPPPPQAVPQPNPSPRSVLTIIISVKDSSGAEKVSTTLTVSGGTGNFAMTMPFANHTSLAGLMDCTVDAVFKENAATQATDTVTNIDFPLEPVGGGGIGQGNVG